MTQLLWGDLFVFDWICDLVTIQVLESSQSLAAEHTLIVFRKQGLIEHLLFISTGRDTNIEKLPLALRSLSCVVV